MKEEYIPNPEGVITIVRIPASGEYATVTREQLVRININVFNASQLRAMAMKASIAIDE